MAPKKPATAFDDEEALVRAIQLEIEKDESLVDAELGELIARLGGVLVWVDGGKIPSGSVKRALRDAKHQMAEALEIEAQENMIPVERLPTERAVAMGGPNFNPLDTSAVESRVVIPPPEGLAAVHHPSEFIIEAYDGYGARRSTGGDSFFVAIRGAQRVRARVTDNNDGSYRCAWTPPQSGTYNIAVSSFGIALPGSPFTYKATPPLAYAPNCVVSGGGLGAAIARATQTFDIEYKDKLGFGTQAVDLDVYVEPVPPGSPNMHPQPASAPPAAAPAEEADAEDQFPAMPQRRAKPAAPAEPSRTGRTSNPDSLREPFDDEGGEGRIASPMSGDGSDDELPADDDAAILRRRVMRVQVAYAPLVIRETEDLQSPQMGVINKGQMMTVVAEKVSRSRTRAMIALDSVSWQAEVVVVKKSSAKEQAAVAQQQFGEGGVGVVDGRSSIGGDDTVAGALDVDGESAGAQSGKIGWVTLVKDGKKFYSTRVRQSTTSRQQHADQWARRVASDRIVTKQKGAAASSEHGGKSLTMTPNVSLEMEADPSGIGFAFGGVYPGTLHAKGKIFDSHKVSYSIGLVGEYLLHVRLRQQAVALPGSPFRLKVTPNEAHAHSTTLSVGNIIGPVGTDADAGCGTTFQTFDLMGNACIAGGAMVTAAVVDKTAAEAVKVTVRDNEDGSYYLHWRATVSGTYSVAIKLFNEHVVGSPTSITLTSVAPLLSKTELYGEGLTQGAAGALSRFRLKFFDIFDNQTAPGPDLKLGLALLQGKTYKDVGESQDFTMAPVSADGCEHEVVFTPKVEGTFSLHVWAEEGTAAGKDKRERTPFVGSPFHCVVVAGKASPETSFVDGWSKESRAVDKHGKAVEQRPDLIIAGDSVICRPVICDALGNNTVPEEGSLSISILLPDGSTIGLDSPSLKLIVASKGGVTTYDVRHEATRAGPHEVHFRLNGDPIKGSPVNFNVIAAVPEVKSAKLSPPTDVPLYSNIPYTIVLKTFDRFGNPIPHGGLSVATRLQIVKQGAHDLTTLVPNNHTVEIEDNEDGTYNVDVSLIKIAATVKVIVNMDKNIPASGGELPAIQLSFELPPDALAPPPSAAVLIEEVSDSVGLAPAGAQMGTPVSASA